MKAPRLDARAMGDFLVRHGEKIVVAVIGLAALALAWGGLRATQSLAVTDKLTPEAVNRAATQARIHIERANAPPADLLPPREPLAGVLDPWRSPLVPWSTGTKPPLTIAASPIDTVLDKPLFEELAKRTKPDVLPIEDVRAVGGLAVVAVGEAPAAAAQQPARPRKAERRPPRGGDPLAGGADAAPAPEAQGAGAPKSRIVPYVVVTGLIPVKKQQEEYRQRFESCGFRDPKRDSPMWCDFEIDRGTVGRDGKETWTRIDLGTVAGAQQAKDQVVADVDREFLLGAEAEVRNKPTTPIPFCSPLPQRIDGAWGLADLHPWVADRVAAKQADAAKPEQPAAPNAAGAGTVNDGPGFDAAEERPAQTAASPAKAEPPEYRLFRFVDTAVEPGATYRYRVRVKVWNPNYSKDPERMRPHVADPAIARDDRLASPNSRPSSAATIPDTTRILVGTLRRDDLKELKIKSGSGTLEVLVLAPSAQAGSFTLRGLVADPGAVIDVDERFNKKTERDRARGEKTTTGRLLVDARGRQEDRGEVLAEKSKRPEGIPEPFEVLCLRPDGSFELASLDGSEPSLAAHGDTLPPRSTKPDARAAAPADALRGGFPADDPLARPGAGK